MTRDWKLGDYTEIIIWHKGNKPPDSCWCLITYLSNDDDPVKRVNMVWFNHHKETWWVGTYGETTPFLWGDKITHWAELPKGAE